MPRLKPTASKAAKKKRVTDEMAKWKAGTLHSGSPDGPKVTSQKQAVAIALSEAGQSKKPKRKKAKK